MTILELLSDYQRPASLDDTVGEALSIALEQGHRNVPVVDEDSRLVATVRLAELVDSPDSEKPLRECRLSTPSYVTPETHVFDAVELVVDNEIDVLPVVDANGHYVGSVDLSSLLRSVSRILGIGAPGSIVEVDVSPRDYALGRLVHTIEEHGARVISITSVRPSGAESDHRVTVKISAADTVRIRAALEHYGFNVVAVDRQQSTAEDIQQRVREFIHYLDV